MTLAAGAVAACPGNFAAPRCSVDPMNTALSDVVFVEANASLSVSEMQLLNGREPPGRCGR